MTDKTIAVPMVRPVDRVLKAHTRSWASAPPDTVPMVRPVDRVLKDAAVRCTFAGSLCSHGQTRG